jgi:hypothetical protein
MFATIFFLKHVYLFDINIMPTVAYFILPDKLKSLMKTKIQITQGTVDFVKCEIFEAHATAIRPVFCASAIARISRADFN